ncbi:MAG: cytochrome d ubiquinol oxidase subunit II [Thiohalocapsa sp.]
MTSAPPLDLVPLWTLILGIAVFMYVLMDGFDLGVGLMFRGAPNEAARDVMMNSVAPIWDGNETWLVLGGGGLLAVFPLAFAIIVPALYFPLTVMLLGLIFRGISFELRFKATGTARRRWSAAFHYGSLVATLAQGLVLGAFVQGFRVGGRAFIGGAFDWLSPFSVVTALGLVLGYALLGATWLIIKTEGELQQWARHEAQWLTVAVLGAMAVVSVWTPLLHPGIWQRWFAWPDILWLSPVPIITAALAFVLWRSLRGGAQYLPFLAAIGLFAMGYIGLAISLWPHIVPPSITLWDAAAAPRSQAFLLVGTMFLLPVVLAYTAWSYWVFRGKVRGDIGYH